VHLGVYAYLDGSLDASVVLGPPVQTLHVVVVLLAVAAQRLLALLLRLRRPAFSLLSRSLTTSPTACVQFRKIFSFKEYRFFVRFDAVAETKF